MIDDADALNEAIENATQDMRRHMIKRARHDGRAAGPEMFTPDHSTFAPIPGVSGAQLFVREDKHPGLSNKPLMDIPDGEYGG